MLACVLVTLFLMLEVFIVMPQEKGTFAYISYLISAYSFIIISVQLWGYLK
ncbi:preprotein translocase subunit SecF, partial [Listeria ivanovii FSL F6-596]